MIEFESCYKENVDIIDKFTLNNIKIDRCVVYNGDVNVIKKEKREDSDENIPTLANAILGLNNTSAPFPGLADFDCWTDIDAQELFLQSKPTCYLILSKPGLGAYSLGEAISKKLQCVHLCPRNIIIDEIEQNSSTGKCVDFNIRHNNVCTFNTIISILKQKLESPAVQHRGYVISGLPIVTSNRSVMSLVRHLYAEDSLQVTEELIYDVLVNLRKKNGKRNHTPSRSSVSSEPEVAEVEAVEEEQVPDEAEEEEVPVELPKFILEPCSDIIFSQKSYFKTKKSVLIEQFFGLMNLKMKPDIIIHITCPDVDVVTKKSHKYYNYINSVNMLEPFVINTETEIRWPFKYSMSYYKNSYDSNIFNYKYNCKQPINFKEKSIEQMCNYKQTIFPFLEKKLKDYDPKFIIKLDGRTSVHYMIHHVTERLMLLPIKPVLIPKPLYLEECPEDMEEFWKSMEVLNVIQSGVITFNRYASPWLNRCPVELKKRQTVKGNPRFAATFFKHVYLLSSLNAMISFCRNPRPFLLLKYLEPTCRVIIVGTVSTGKTMISQCLSWIFDAPVICYKTFLDSEKKKKYDFFARTILSQIIAPIEEIRLNKWQNLEENRLSNLDTWYKTILNSLKSYIPLLIEHMKYNKSEGEEISESFKNKFQSIRNQLSILPMLDDLKQCKNALQNKDILSYAPIDLLTPKEKPRLPILGDDDVTEAISAHIVANDLQKEIQPTPEEIIDTISKTLFGFDTESLQGTSTEPVYGKWIIDGFTSDPEYWNLLADFKLLPDITIALIENREIEPELLRNYNTIQKNLKNYQERYLLASDPLLKTRLKTKEVFDLKLLDMQIIVNDLLNNILDSIGEEDNMNNEADMLTSLTESIEKFRENWDTLKIKLDENSKSLIEVELENKSDIQVIEEVLLRLRQSYYLSCALNEDDEIENVDDEDESPKNILVYNHPNFLCDTNIFCPIAYYKYGVLWEGKREFSLKYDNKVHYFCNEDCLQLFQKDITKYQLYNKPYKVLPPLRICVIGSIGSGKSTVSKLIAKELGLLHIDFSEIINEYLIPKHFKKVGRKYENSFTDVPIDEEAVVEFQMDEDNENLESDILANEGELRRMINNYFERGAPLFSFLMQKLIKRLWFQSPYSTTGFVLDGFPRLSADVEDMISCFCIPDLVIELEGSSETMLERLSPKMFKTWKSQLIEAKNKARAKFDNERKLWMNLITKNVVVKLICNEILDNLPIEFPPGEPDLPVLPTDSVIIDADLLDSSNVNAKLLTIYNAMVEEYPEPVDTSEWEKPDEVREKIESRLEGIYESDEENIQRLKDLLSEQKIKVLTINSTQKVVNVLRTVLLKLSNVRNRSESLFEQTFTITCDIAEVLISEGFYFLSKFNRTCPVYTSENRKTILNPYKVSKHRNKIFPIIHRSYIYFINGEDNVEKFRINPLKYVHNVDIIKSFVEYPLRIGIVGPPKSGKSTLAAKLAKEYGLICISRGIAVRSVLENIHWTELAARMLKALHAGDYIDSDLIMKAIQTVSFDHRAVTQGYVFDGFPETVSEAVELSREGLYPLIIFDLSCNKYKNIENSQSEIYTHILKTKPPYSFSFIDYRYNKWYEKKSDLRYWIQQDVQNLHILNGSESRWQCFHNAIAIIMKITLKLHYYVTNVNSTIVPVDALCISNEIFQQRMSDYKDMCPLCLRNNIVRHSSFPVNKKGLVQYKNTFYWICNKHMDEVLKRSERSLIPPKIMLPETPAVVNTINLSLVYENGICIVTYAEHLPAQMLKRGNKNHAANYRGKVYLFCSAKCLDIFLAKPHVYCDIVIFKKTKLLPELSLKKLPDLGYLEQTVGNILTDACCLVNVLRPKYPGLSAKVSGLLYIALYLKTHNSLKASDDPVTPKYVKAFKVYEGRSKLIINLGLRLRSMDNPFAKYPKCCANTGGHKTQIAKMSSTNITPHSSSTMSHKTIDNIF